MLFSYVMSVMIGLFARLNYLFNVSLDNSLFEWIYKRYDLVILFPSASDIKLQISLLFNIIPNLLILMAIAINLFSRSKIKRILFLASLLIFLSPIMIFITKWFISFQRNSDYIIRILLASRGLYLFSFSALLIFAIMEYIYKNQNMRHYLAICALLSIPLSLILSINFDLFRYHGHWENFDLLDILNVKKSVSNPWIFTLLPIFCYLVVTVEVRKYIHRLPRLSSFVAICLALISFIIIYYFLLMGENAEIWLDSAQLIEGWA